MGGGAGEQHSKVVTVGSEAGDFLVGLSSGDPAAECVSAAEGSCGNNNKRLQI